MAINLNDPLIVSNLSTDELIRICNTTDQSYLVLSLVERLEKERNTLDNIRKFMRKKIHPQENLYKELKHVLAGN